MEKINFWLEKYRRQGISYTRYSLEQIRPSLEEESEKWEKQWSEDLKSGIADDEDYIVTNHYEACFDLEPFMDNLNFMFISPLQAQKECRRLVRGIADSWVYWYHFDNWDVEYKISWISNTLSVKMHNPRLDENGNRKE